jgi:hypothetical protein
MITKITMLTKNISTRFFVDVVGFVNFAMTS